MGAAAEPGRGGDCPPREINVTQETDVAWETNIAQETNVSQETRVADLAATARLSRSQPFVLPRARAAGREAWGDTATPTPGLPRARRRSRGGCDDALVSSSNRSARFPSSPATRRVDPFRRIAPRRLSLKSVGADERFRGFPIPGRDNFTVRTTQKGLTTSAG